MTAQPTVPMADRRAAGLALADELAIELGAGVRAPGPPAAAFGDIVVLALPRGGVPVAAEVARRLGAPLDLMIVRKLGHPDQPELAMGAIASGGVLVLNDSIAADVDPAAFERVLLRERAELQRRERLYRGDRAPLALRGRRVVLVDDGLATGATMRAAAEAVARQQPARVMVAVPVAAADSLALLADRVDDVVCLATPEPFHAIGPWYRDFSQVSDDEVRMLLEAAWAREAERR
jgi:putative phosphoribosyl transferase